MKRTWTIIGVSDVREVSPGTNHCSASKRHRLNITTLGSFATPMELCCSAFTSGARTSIPP